VSVCSARLTALTAGPTSAGCVCLVAVLPLSCRCPVAVLSQSCHRTVTYVVVGQRDKRALAQCSPSREPKATVQPNRRRRAPSALAKRRSGETCKHILALIRRPLCLSHSRPNHLHFVTHVFCQGDVGSEPAECIQAVPHNPPQTPYAMLQSTCSTRTLEPDMHSATQGKHAASTRMHYPFTTRLSWLKYQVTRRQKQGDIACTNQPPTQQTNHPPNRPLTEPPTENTPKMHKNQ
jgi:hypothetical protein